MPLPPASVAPADGSRRRARRGRPVALLLALLPTLASACGGGGGDAPTEPPPPPPPPPPRVQALPAGGLGIPTGGVVQLTASVVSAAGQPVAGRIVSWRSLDTTVATVTGGGAATGVRPGSTRFVATSGEAIPDTLDVAVSAHVTATALLARSRMLPAVGWTARLEARSHAGAAEHPGVYSWASRDPAIATVDGGVVTARGLGTTWVVVHEAHGTADSAQVRVADVRMSIWPATMINSAPIFQTPRPLVLISEPLDEDLVVRLSSTDPTVGAPVADSVVIARGDTSAVVELRVGAPGAARIDLRADPIPLAVIDFTSAQPQIRHQNMSLLPDAYRLPVGSEIQLMASLVTTADAPHIIARNLGEEQVITAVSTDTTVVRIVRGTLRIPAGEAFVPFGEWGIARAVGPGTAWVRLTAPGARPDSLLPFIVRP